MAVTPSPCSAVRERRPQPSIPVDERDVQQTRGEVLNAISTEMVRLYRHQFGRGPSSVRTDWAGPDTLVSLLFETLTPAERNLARLSEHERLREMRMFFQYASVRDFCEPVERLTGRKVRAFLSSIDTYVDGGVAGETFVLYPPGFDGDSRIDLGP
jgi:uncharacterized protein YbcI